MNEPHIRFYRLPHGMDLPLPAYETVGSAGMDLRAAIGDSATVTIEPGRRMLVPTGLIAAIAPGFEGQVRPRSGLAFKHGVTCLNTPGTIDSDYRGELHVLLVNHGDETFAITRGMRIAQLVVAPVVRAVIIETDQLPEPTERNEGGFGSTGTA